MICQYCGDEVGRFAPPCMLYVAGAPPVRSRGCLDRELAQLRRFIANVRAADRLTTSETAIAIRRLIVDWDRGAR